MSDLPLHIRIMASLGIVKITQKRLPSEYQRSTERKKLKWPGMAKILPMGIILPILLSMIPLLTNSNHEDDLKAEIEKVANSEDKLAWQNKQWENPNTPTRLMELKTEIDNSSCEKLVKLFEDNERWTLRPYTAHKILEKNCK